MKNLVARVKKFEREMEWNKTPSEKIIKFLKKDARELREKNLKHKTLDIFFEVIQLAARNKINLEKEISKHMRYARKKYL